MNNQDQPNEQPSLESTPIPVDSPLFSNPALLAALEKFTTLSAPTAPAEDKKKGPYYTEVYANFAKKILDALHKDRFPVKITSDSGSIQTERLRYYQGSAYLVDKLAPTGHYKSLKEQPRCQDSSDFLLFSARKKRKVSEPTVVKLDDWKTALDDFIDAAVHGEKFARLEILLSVSELTYISSRLVGVEQLFQNLSNENRILIIRFDLDKL